MHQQHASLECQQMHIVRSTLIPVQLVRDLACAAFHSAGKYVEERLSGVLELTLGVAGTNRMDTCLIRPAPDKCAS